MKFVQTVWFKENKTEINYSAGWLSLHFHLMSWALSSYQLSQFFSQKCLMTDEIGAELAQKLHLPYTQIQTDLETVKQQNALWVSNKLYTYSVQQQPFIHLDTDAYFFNNIDPQWLSAPLLAQNFEYDHENYCHAYNDVITHCPFIPDLIKKDQLGRLTAVNAGVMGGTNWLFFKEFAQFVEEFLIRNEAHLAKCHYDHLNVFVEQYLFKQFADAKGIPVSYISPKEFGPPCDYKMTEFAKLPLDCQYIHITNYKQNPAVCEQMAQRLWLESPELHERVTTVCRTLEATHHPILLPEPPLPNPFYRTTYLLSKLGLFETDQLLTQPEISTLIAAREESPEGVVLSDVFQYETRLLEFNETLPNGTVLWADWENYSRRTNTLLALPPEEYLQKTIGQSPRCVRLDSAWNWAEVSEFAGQTANRDLAQNLTADPSYYETVLYIYVHQGLVREHLLDVLNILILDTLEEPAMMQTVVDSVVEQVCVHQPATNTTELASLIVDRIRHFLYHGVLELIR